MRGPCSTTRMGVVSALRWTLVNATRLHLHDCGACPAPTCCTTMLMPASSSSCLYALVRTVLHSEVACKGGSSGELGPQYYITCISCKPTYPHS